MADIAELNDREVILALEELTETLTVDTTPDSMPMDADEAHSLLATLLKAGGRSATEISALDGPGQYAAARRFFLALADEPAAADAASAVLADPPVDTRLGTELAVPAVAVLAAAVTWLQTKIDVRIKRKEGKTEFEFRIAKDVVPADVLKGLAASIVQLWNGGSKR